MNARRRRTALAGALLLVAVLVSRLVALDLDPPQDVDIAFFSDEGWWADCARNRVLFGDFVLDDHAVPLHMAPLYTLALTGLFEVTGPDLVSTRWLAALAGVATLGIVFAALRGSGARRAAWAATAILTCDYVLWTYQRLGLVESFQLLWVTAAVLAAARALERPAWASAAGLCAVAALASKPTGGVGGAAAGLLLAHGVVRGATPEARRRARRALGIFAVAAVGAALPLLWGIGASDGALRELVEGVRMAGGGDAPLLERLARFGQATSPGPTSFFTHSGALVIAVAAVGVAGALAAPVASRPSALGRAAWIWLALAAVEIALQSYQPDRRFLLLTPPLAILLGLACEPGATLPARSEAAARPRRVRLAAGLGLGVALLLVAREPWLHGVAAATAGWPLGREPGLGPTALQMAAWLPPLALGVLAVALGVRVLPSRARRLTAWPLALGVALVGALQIAGALRHPTRTIVGAEHTLAAMVAELPPARRVLVGNAADSLGMSSDAFTFLIRRWPFGPALNLDGLVRFRPTWAVVVRVDGVHAGGGELFATRTLPVVRRIPLWPDARGRFRAEALVYAAPDPVVVPNSRRARAYSSGSPTSIQRPVTGTPRSTPRATHHSAR